MTPTLQGAPREAADWPCEAGKERVNGRQIMTADEIRRATIRMSHEIVEKQAGTDGLVLIGIQRRGVPLARRIAAGIREHLTRQDWKQVIESDGKLEAVRGMR